MKKIIFTKNAPEPVGPYSQAVEKNGMLFISGQIGIDPSTGKLVAGDVTEQTDMVLKNIQAIVSEAGYGYNLQNILKCTIYLKDMAYYADMNSVYSKYFSSDAPARAAFAVRELPLDVMVEIEAIAMR
ncbi:MAG: RidA family protein [Bacteroidales bacterium]|jgi:2-iminobutanoate/2-iminopropanoate deaminase|nr:RidA family protein [Bacteroidales bacterium]MDG2080384.1 RidA family protein [Bacteroidales bacterium]